MKSLTIWSGEMSRHEISEGLIERSLQVQERIDKAERCIETYDIKGLLDLGLIDRRTYQDWLISEENEQDLVDNYGRDYNPSFEHYNRAMEKADKNIKLLKKEVKDLVSKSRAVLRQASRVASQYMSKTAASGNYGFTKAVQKDVEVALRRLQKKVDELARKVESKHPEAGVYFGTRCQGSKCNASKALSNSCLINQTPKRVMSGPLGFKPSCARASHKAITDLILHAGAIAHGLHNKSRDHVPYLTTHAKKKRCPLTRLLLENYPVETVL